MPNGDNPTTWLTQLRVDLGGLILTSVDHPDNDGAILKDIEGWNGVPPAKGSSSPNPVGPGNLLRSSSQLRKASREITLTGSIYGDDYLQFAGRKARLSSILARAQLLLLRMTQTYGQAPTAQHTYRSIMVEVDDVKITDDHGKPRADFVIYLSAPNPMKLVGDAIGNPFTAVSPTDGSYANLISYSDLTYPEGGSVSKIRVMRYPSDFPISDQLRIEFLLGTEMVGELWLTLHNPLPNTVVDIFPEQRMVVVLTPGVRASLAKAMWPSLPAVVGSGAKQAKFRGYSVFNTNWFCSTEFYMKEW